MEKRRKPIVLVDIDGTIVDTGKLFRLRVSRVAHSLASLTFGRELAAAVRALFTPSSFARTPQAYDGTFLSGEMIRQAVYPDAAAGLAPLSEAGRLGIWSQSATGYQMHKLRSTGLSHLFDPECIIISPNKVRALRFWKRKMHDEIVVVDNDTGKLSNVRGFPNTHCVFMNRNNRKTDVPYPSVQSFNAVLPVLKRLFRHTPHGTAPGSAKRSIP